MTTNYVEEGKVIEYSNTGSAISAGDVVVTGDTVGIALVDIAATSGVGSVAIEGVFTVAKTTGEAWVQGDALAWDASVSEFTKTLTPASGDVADCGIAYAAAASAAATGQIKLLGGASAAAVT